VVYFSDDKQIVFNIKNTMFGVLIMLHCSGLFCYHVYADLKGNQTQLIHQAAVTDEINPKQIISFSLDTSGRLLIFHDKYDGIFSY